MSRPYVSALIGTYNHERFIAEAIESVLAQDFPTGEMEILVVDDGSTDATPDIVRRYGDRVRYIRKENGGQASVFNAGFAEARGEVISLLDGDDYWAPQKLARVCRAFREDGELGFVYHRFSVVMENDGTCPEEAFHPISGYAPDSVEKMLAIHCQATSAYSLRRSTLGRIGPVPVNLRIIADGFVSAAAIFVGPVMGIDERLAWYRIHGGNLFNFLRTDNAKMKTKAECAQVLAQATGQWLRESGYESRYPRAAAALLARYELEAQRTRFALRGAKRTEIFHHLVSELKTYSPVWSFRYRAFRALGACSALALGYERYVSLRASYTDAHVIRTIRRSLLPRES